MDYFEMYETFAGRKPDVRYMIESRGLASNSTAPSDAPAIMGGE